MIFLVEPFYRYCISYNRLIPIPSRLYGYGAQSEVAFKKIKAPLYGKCVSVSGTVLKVSSVKPLVVQLAFKCSVCQEVNVSGFPLKACDS